MKFSVLMSVYYKESATAFSQALQSILEAQTRKPGELVLVCDGPLTGDLDAVIDTYAARYGQQLRVYRLEQNSGLGVALNYGLSRCENELVARADSDDVCAPTRFEKQLAYLEQHPQIMLLGSDIDEFLDDPGMPFRYKKMPQTNEQILKMLRFRNPINHMTAVFRKSAVERAGSYEHLQYMEDYYLWTRLLAAGAQAANLPEPLVHARVGNGMSGRRGDRVNIESRRTLCRYMLAHGMLNRFEYARNIAAITALVYMPDSLRRYSYKKILRKTIS